MFSVCSNKQTLEVFSFKCLCSMCVFTVCSNTHTHLGLLAAGLFSTLNSTAFTSLSYSFISSLSSFFSSTSAALTVGPSSSNNDDVESKTFDSSLNNNDVESEMFDFFRYAGALHSWRLDKCVDPESFSSEYKERFMCDYGDFFHDPKHQNYDELYTRINVDISRN